MECRVWKWVQTAGFIGKLEILALMEKTKQEKNGNILIVVLLQGLILMGAILKYLHPDFVTPTNLHLMNMLIWSVKTMTETMQEKKSGWYIL